MRPNTYNVQSNSSLIDQLLIPNGSWLMTKAHGSCLKALGKRLMAHGQETLGARAGAWATQRQIFLCHEP